MSIQLVSISHKIAPLEIRKLFAFTKEQQIHLMKALIEEADMKESVIIATCNRTEVYTYLPDERARKSVFTRMQELILEEAGALHEENITDYIHFYENTKAIRHLFHVTTGLDSMVMGEDQILGQVKHAHEQAREVGTSGKYLNTFFRYAVTAAKKVKTDTELSKTSVSTGTLAIKAVEEKLGNLDGKKIMVIGGTGQIGQVVLKNLCAVRGVHIFSTTRNIALTHEAHAKYGSSTVVDYKDRYEYIDEMDAVISATASPHYTMTADKVADRLSTMKSRVFVDLAVPIDIDQGIAELPHTALYNMDDFAELAKTNNQMKEQAAIEAGGILENYERDFERWMIFQQAVPDIKEVKQWMLTEADQKGFERAIDKLFYRIRENATPEELQMFFRCMREEN